MSFVGGFYVSPTGRVIGLSGSGSCIEEEVGRTHDLGKILDAYYRVAKPKNLFGRGIETAAPALLHDQKGDLIVGWFQKPEPFQQDLFEILWEYVRNEPPENVYHVVISPDWLPAAAQLVAPWWDGYDNQEETR